VIQYIDLHTEGEPTRVITSGFPDLGAGSIRQRCEFMKKNFSELCSGIVREPRGHEAMVAALLLEPVDQSCDHGVIFFNNVGPLGMCGHGTMGVVRALKDQGLINSEKVSFETPAGIVEARIDDGGRISVVNVESYCHRKDEEVITSSGRKAVGDIAWDGNWFFISEIKGLSLEMQELGSLKDYAAEIRAALDLNEICGEGGACIDHVELHENLERDRPGVRSFTLCPGMEWDRSPCGTGTSATLACMVERNEINEGEVWTQESLLGSRFEATWESGSKGIIPTISGRAWPSSKGELIFEEDDPFRNGFPS